MSGELTSIAKIVVLADDLSGAAELAGIAFAHGLSAEVRRAGYARQHRVLEQTDADRAAQPTQVLAIDTDSRHLDSTAAAARVKQITEQIVATNPAWLFKKVDSVLRGNVRAEIEAILEATGHPRAILIPANPSRGRIIRGGQYLIDGLPLDQTHFARDPQHPRLSSDVLTLLGPKIAEIALPDVENGFHLDQFASQCDATTLPAGAADFFCALLKHRAPQSARGRESLSATDIASRKPSSDKDSRPLSVQLIAPAILICGSRAAWPVRRNACLAASIPVCTIHDPITKPLASGALLLGIGDVTSASSGENALPILAQQAARLLAQLPASTILAEGGATAAAIAHAMHWQRFQVVATAPAGVGVLQPLAPGAPLFLIKPGSYPWPSEIWQAFCQCNDHRGGR